MTEDRPAPTIIDRDWLLTETGEVLHHATIHGLDPDDRFIVEQLWTDLGRNIRLDCGRVAKSVYIPGMFTRMVARRCVRCCRANGYPDGIGSPKNDPGLRALLGLSQPSTSDEGEDK